MTTFNFSIQVPDDIEGNKDWFNFIAKMCNDMAEAYRDCAEDADNLPETHPFYASMLPTFPVYNDPPVTNIYIPDLLKWSQLNSFEVHEATTKGVFYFTVEDVRLAVENCLQDHSYAYLVSIRDDLFIIEPLLDNGGE